MRIALVTVGTVPAVGGLSTHLETLSHGLAELGHQAVILSHWPSSSFAGKLLREACWQAHSRLGRGLGPALSFFARTYEATHRLRRMLRDAHDAVRFDVVSCHDVRTVVAVLPFVQRAGLPIQLTVHDYLADGFVGVGVIPRDSRWERMLLRWERLAYRAADQVVCVDSRLARHVERVSEGAVEPITIYNCAHPAFFLVGAERLESYPTPATGPMRILCPRRLTPKNGVRYAVEMARELFQRGVAFELRLAGDGEERKTISDLIERYGLRSRVRMLGPLDRAAVLQQMRETDAVVVPSVNHEGVEEATSISVLEGMAAALPVIGSNIGGIPELIEDGVSGLLVPQRDPRALADAICWLSSDPALRATLGRAAHEVARSRHSHIAHARQFLSVFEKCIALRAAV